MSDLPKTLTDKQAMFDAAYIGLAGQGFRLSLGKNPALCKYRGDDGLKCAIGHCIPDDLYDAKFEAKAASKLPCIPYAMHCFANDLQQIHDDCSVLEEMRGALHEFAASHGLTIPSIEGQS